VSGRRRAPLGVVAAVMVAVLAGCALPTSSPNVSVPASVVVEPGDTVYGIARRYNIPQRDIIELNGLQAPYLLAVGQVLRLPAPRIYRVVSGDTLYGISRRYNVGLSELAELNGVLPPYRIYLGQELRLPSTAGVQIADSGGAAPVPAPVPPRSQAEPRLSGTATAVTRANPTPPPAASAPPIVISPPASAAATPPPVFPAITPPPASRPQPSAPAGTVPIPSPRPSTVAVAPAPQPAAVPVAPSTPPRAGSRFAWPVEGPIISTFGPKGQGAHNDGINIAAARGTPVRAADNGVVAYAGNELRGYGNLILIRHDGGWVTAYGHNDQILVRRGEQVTVGQTIATVGSTGAVGSPQLHFEIRRGTEAINPLDQMPPMPST